MQYSLRNCAPGLIGSCKCLFSEVENLKGFENPTVEMEVRGGCYSGAVHVGV